MSVIAATSLTSWSLNMTLHPPRTVRSPLSLCAAGVASSRSYDRQPLRGNITKLVGLDLVAACQGNLFFAEKEYVARYLVARQSFSQISADLVGFDAGPVVRHDTRDNNFAECFMRQANGFGHFHRRMLPKRIVNFQR